MFILSRDPAHQLAVELCQRLSTPYQVADEFPDPNSEIALSSIAVLTPEQFLYCLRHNIRVNTPRLDTRCSSGIGQFVWPLMLELTPLFEQAAGESAAASGPQEQPPPTGEDGMRLLQATESMRALKEAYPASREAELALAILEGRDPELPGDRTQSPPATAPAGAVRVRFENGKYADPEGKPVEKGDAAVFTSVVSAETWLGLAINRKLHDPTFPKDALPAGEANCEPVEAEEAEQTPEELHLARLQAQADAMPETPSPGDTPPPDEATRKRGRRPKSAAWK